MTNITLWSDLHLEFSYFSVSNRKKSDVLILSGDILPAIELKKLSKNNNYLKFLQECADCFRYVIYVAGNHEFYYGKYYESLSILKNTCKKFSNIHFLENKYVTINDIIFVGATLWTDCNNSNPLSVTHIHQIMNDYHIIAYDPPGDTVRKLHPFDTVKLHSQTLEYFKTVLNQNKNKKVVVVTHHAPSSLSIDPSYRDSFHANGAYYSDLSSFILDHPEIKLWTHGHTHVIQDYMIGSTRVLCNPRGYQSPYNNEITYFDPFLTISL